MKEGIHVIFDLPSGSQADITFFNRTDAKYAYDAVASHARLKRMPPPRMVTYREEDVEDQETKS